MKLHVSFHRLSGLLSTSRATGCALLARGEEIELQLPEASISRPSVDTDRREALRSPPSPPLSQAAHVHRTLEKLADDGWIMDHGWMARAQELGGRERCAAQHESHSGGGGGSKSCDFLLCGSRRGSEGMIERKVSRAAPGSTSAARRHRSIDVTARSTTSLEAQKKPSGRRGCSDLRKQCKAKRR